jgi:nitroreductase
MKEGFSMDVFEAIKGRRSCRKFIEYPVEREKIIKMLGCAIYAPSPANKQPWEFIVTDNMRYNQMLKKVAESTKEKLAARSGWKWLATFNIDFITEAPILIVVVGDPKKHGAEHFLDAPSLGYQHACSASIQNMLLAAYAQGLSTLWLSLFEKKDVRKIFSIADEKDPLAIICVGYGEQSGEAPPRKEIQEKVIFLS